jgi:hypothetical protein
MKKNLLLLVAVSFSLTQLFAQESTFNKGDKVINLGIGFGSTYYGSIYGSHSPALSGSFEVGIKDNILEKGSIGIGGYAGYSSAKYASYWKTTNFLIGARGSFHYPLVEKLDTYTGLLLGYNIFSTKYYSTYNVGGSASSIAFAWFAGARYYFNDKFAGMAEIGYGIAYLTIGVSLKL